jgi:uncharacterized protein YdiU (UPF0061 family)
VAAAFSDWPAAQHRFARPGAAWAQPVQPSPLPHPRWLAYNPALAASLGLPADWPEQAAALAVLAGHAPWPGVVPSASAYAGHQFGRFNPQLGDGRVALIAEITDVQGQPQELQLKGCGPTPYARGGDGRAVWRSSIREYLASEALHALGVPTTRALALVVSDLAVQREGPERAAVLCRVAPSFVRFGHFEHLAHQGPPGALPALADHVIATHFPALSGRPQRHALWLRDVLGRTASLIAQWQTLGFCHGVMNTDNFSILGLTLDHGPFGFMDRFRAHHIANSSDHEGRYAWTAQPAVAQWNCGQLLRACASLLADEPDAAGDLAAHFAQAYDAAVMERWRAKLGSLHAHDGDGALVNQWLTLMQQGRCDFTLSFRALAALPEPGLPVALRERFAQPAAFDAWLARYHARLAAEGQQGPAARLARGQRMRAVNPLFVLRNHLAQRAISAAEAGDAQPLHTLLRVLSRPCAAQPGMDAWAQPPGPAEPHLEVSCSA